MTAVVEHAPHTTIAPPRPAATDDGRWEVSPATSVATVRTELPFGRSASVRFSELVGLVDLAEPGNRTIALLIASHSLETAGRRRRRRWLGPHVLDADQHPRIALALEELDPVDGDDWYGRARLRVKRRVAEVDAHVTVDRRRRRAVLTFGVDRDALDLVWAQTAGSTHQPLGRRLDVVIDLALTPRGRLRR